MSRPSAKNRFLLLYASQTGTAEEIAEDIASEAPQYGLQADLKCTSLCDVKFCILSEPCIVFIIATSGFGEPPNTALNFGRRLISEALEENHLAHLSYSLLALGDSNYEDTFCMFGFEVDKRLRNLGAKLFYPMGIGDDAQGIENGAIPWIQGLWPALQKQHGITPNQNIIEINTTHLEASEVPLLECFQTIFDVKNYVCKKSNIGKYSYFPKWVPPRWVLYFTKGYEREFDIRSSFIHSQASAVCSVKLAAARCLTFGENVKSTLELTFQFQNETLQYIPGDSFGFLCSNPVDEVNLLLNRLNVWHQSLIPIFFELHPSIINPKKLPSFIPTNTSLRDILLHYLEIRAVPKKILLRICSHYTSDKKEKYVLRYLSSKEGANAYINCIKRKSVSILDILFIFKTCQPPIGRILEYLPKLKPRFYSITSSPYEDHSKFKIICNVVKLPKEAGRYKSKDGVCTGWLNELYKKFNTVHANHQNSFEQTALVSHQVYVYKKTNFVFMLPADVTIPIIMVCSGTGIAPFMSFLKCRYHMKQNEKCEFGETWLFYGCRYKDRDFLYKDELQRLHSNNSLNHLIVSHSREIALTSVCSTKYVHESIKLHAKDITEAVKSGAIIYICGNGGKMVNDVHAAFVEVFERKMGFSREQSESFVMELQEDKRFLSDVWI